MDLTETFSWRGRDVAWSRIGSGEPVAFCHGTTCSSKTWARFADALSRDFCVYLWDNMPGYGQSSKRPEHNVDLTTQGELFTDLLAEWNIGAPHVVAHDFGGAVFAARGAPSWRSLRVVIRTHQRMGAGIIQPAPDSMVIPGTVAQWEEWAAVPLPATGLYAVPQTLNMLDVNREADLAVYPRGEPVGTAPLTLPVGNRRRD